MRTKTWTAVAAVGALSLGLAGQAAADSEQLIVAQAGGPAGASAVGTGPTGGTPSPRTAGEPASPGATAERDAMPSFLELDKNNDGQISQAEWDSYQSARSGAATGGTVSPSGSAVTAPSSPSPTGATAGPGSASNRTAPSSDTATSPSTSGHGKPK